MLGGLGNLPGLFKQAKEMQEQMAKIQEELATRRFEGEAGAGLVKAYVNGKKELVDIRIDPKAVEDVELLEDLVKSSVAAAMQKAQAGSEEELAKLTGGLNIPGLSDLLNKGG